MKFARRFSIEGRDPFLAVEYETRKSVIRQADGISAQRELQVEVPKGWSQTATDILAQKYLRRSDIPVTGPDGGLLTGPETSAKQVVGRLSGCWRHWGMELGYFDSPAEAEVFHDEIVHMLLTQMASPNSPQWFNTGLAWKYGIQGEAQGHYYVDPADGETKPSADAYTRPQPHACFIQSVQDDLLGENGLYGLLAKEGRIFKYGSGTGTNFSSIRAAGEPLRGGGTSSGLMSFLRVFDRAAGAIKSGGTTRRAAKMVCLDMDHPEIEEFILWKSREEAKVVALAAGSRLMRSIAGFARVPGGQKETSAQAFIPEGYLARLEGLARQGLDPEAQPEFDTGFEGEAYSTVSGQNSNNSVRIPNRFLKAVADGADWVLTARTDGRPVRSVKASRLWDLVGLAAWECADPGVQFSDTINEWHTCPKDGPIRASNPCSEYMFLDDTACNLAGLNLVAFQDEDGSLRIGDFRHAVRLWTVVLDISVGMAQFPSPDIARRSYDYRTLGLGYANLGAFLMRAGIPYDSPEASAWTGCITALMGGCAYAASGEMAEALGPFPRFLPNREDMLRVIRNHARAAWGTDSADYGPGGYDGLTAMPAVLDASLCPPGLVAAARKAWEEALTYGSARGYRNAQVTVLALTGTTGLLMDCDTTGIEPDFSLVKFKKLAGSGFLKIINRSVPAALRKLGYRPAEVEAISLYCLGRGSLAGAPHVDPAELARRGIPKEKSAAIEDALQGSLSVTDAFTPAVLGRDFLLSLGITAEAMRSGGAGVLSALGYSEAQIEEADLAVCGAQNVEGAPFLDARQYPVFDCANRCGRGTRSIAAQGHLRIMAAAQPFLSGAISKTVNLPAEASVEEVKAVYRACWGMMIKAVAIYRDGSKLSQPLTSKRAAPREQAAASISAPVPAHAPIPPASRPAVRHPTRKRLPARRAGFVQEVAVSGHKLFLRTGEYPDGTLGEIFIDMYKEGAAYRGILNCFAVLTSKSLQYGVPLEELVDTFTFTRFEPSGPVNGHENIKNCTSLLDLIFRILGLSYLGKTDFVHVKPVEIPVWPPAPSSAINGYAGVAAVPNGFMNEESAAPRDGNMPMSVALNAGYAGECCSACESVRVRRNGTCMVCEDCGTTSGCS